jgi:hypothetical protein
VRVWIGGGEGGQAGQRFAWNGRGRKLKGTQRGWMGRRGGGQVFMVVEKSSEARLGDALPDRAAAKPRGSDRSTKMI